MEIFIVFKKFTPNLGGGKKFFYNLMMIYRSAFFLGRNRYFVFDNRPTFRCIISVFKKFGNMGAEGEKTRSRGVGEEELGLDGLEVQFFCFHSF